MVAMEQLGIIAQLGAIYAGFLSIFLVFVRREGRFSPADSLWVRSIIYASFGVVFGALIPLAFSLFGFEGARLWRTASFIALAGAILSAGDVARYHIALSAKDREMVGFAHSMITWSLVSQRSQCWRSTPSAFSETHRRHST